MLGWFRRHAKVLMVVLGSAAMAIFGLGPVFDALANRSNSSYSEGQEIVATWNGGKISKNDLMALQQRHFQTQRFLQGVREMAISQKGDTFRDLALPISPIRDGEPEYIEDQLISRMLMAERAKQEGVVVSDGMVNDYIEMVSGTAGFSKSDLEAINREANNNRCSLVNIREHLKLELLNNQMALYTLTGIPMIPNTTESAELHGRSSQRIECEVVPVDIKAIAEKMTEKPSSSEMNTLFSEGKSDFKDPLGIRPGFKIPRKVNVQYLMASKESFLRREMEKISPEALEEEYNRLVAEKSPLVTETVPDDNSLQLETPPPTDPKEVKEPPADVTEPPVEGDAPSDVTPPPTDSGEEKVELEAPAEEKVELEVPASEKPAEETPAKEGEEKQSSFEVEGQKYQFVSTTSPQETAETTEAVQEKPAEEKTAETPEAGGIGEIQQALEKTEAEEDKVIIKPLKDVADVVKRSMCDDAATKAMEDALTRASVYVENHLETIILYEFKKERGEAAEEPGDLDYEKIAEKYNLIAGESGLVGYEELSGEQIGRVQTLTQQVINGRVMPQFELLANAVFEKFGSIELFASSTVNEWTTQNQYLYWVAEKADSRDPEFKECEDEIVSFWRLQQAFDKAKSEADSIASKVNSEKKKLSELYPERAVSTGAFSWFNSFGSFGMGRPVGVENPGDDFMQTAFSLGEMETGAAPNRNRETFYVIQSLTGTQAADEYGMDYLENQLFKYKRIPTEVQQVSRYYGQELNLDWNQEFNEMMGLKFTNR